jgi:hypothetical protein
MAAISDTKEIYLSALCVSAVINFGLGFAAALEP